MSWIIAGVVWCVVALWVWALCRAGALADRQIEALRRFGKLSIGA